jgi:hypothetical protein
VRKSIEVGGEVFRTKGALLERIRGILYGCPVGSVVAEAEAAFLTACLQAANRFYGHEVEDPVRWEVWQQRVGGGRYPEFYFIRENGTRENPSIRRLSTQKSKIEKVAKDAARQSVLSQIMEFRNGLPSYQCEGCPANGGADATGFEVHHAGPTFNELWAAFVARVGVDEDAIPVIEFRDDTGIMIGFDLGPPYNFQFSAFHEEHAKLKLLCLECHKAETRKVS